MTQKKWAALIVGSMIVLIVAYGLGFRWNFTHSVPTGLWRLEDGTIQHGDYVQVSPNDLPWYRLGVEREYYRHGASLLKKVVALEGDVVSLDASQHSVTVDDVHVSLSEWRSRDIAGRVMPSPPPFPIRLKAGEAWLASENERGYDSRYFGPVHTRLLRRARLIFKL